MLRKVLLAGMAAAQLGGCSGSDSTQPRVPTSIRLSHAQVQIEEGERVTVTANIIDQHDVAFSALPPGYLITWESGAPGIVTVEGGVLTAHAPGHGLVVATAGNLPPAGLEVQVTARHRVPAYIALALPDGGWIQHYALNFDQLAQTAAFTVVLLDEHYIPFNTPPPGYPITWETENPAIATVADGTITATGVGQTWVTARSGNLNPGVIQVRSSAPTQLTFDYTGDRDGTFAIETTVVQVIWGQSWSWAVSFYDTEFKTQDIIAQRVRPDGRFDLLWLWVDGRVTGPGTSSVAADDGWLVLGLNPLTGALEGEYDIVSGSISFSAVTPYRLEGSFALVMSETDSEATLNVTAGVFDLPVVDESVPLVLGGLPALLLNRRSTLDQ